jgi:hypothetical protein
VFIKAKANKEKVIIKNNFKNFKYYKEKYNNLKKSKTLIIKNNLIKVYFTFNKKI